MTFVHNRPISNHILQSDLSGAIWNQSPENGQLSPDLAPSFFIQCCNIQRAIRTPLANALSSLYHWRTGEFGKPMQMIDQELLSRVTVDPAVCEGKPVIRGARIAVATILDALLLGLSPAQILEHYPSLESEDIEAALAFATDVAEKNGGVAVVGRQYLQTVFHPRTT
jgi:uncharacterized protein (DUF433 family)